MFDLLPELRFFRREHATVILELRARPNLVCVIASEGSRYVMSAWVHDLETDEDITIPWDEIVGVSSV